MTMSQSRAPGRLARAPEHFLDPQQIAAVQAGRRDFLRGAFLAAAAAATGHAGAQPVGDAAILELPEHGRSLGQSRCGTTSTAPCAAVQKILPNRDGMTRAHGLWDVKGKGDVANVACMKDCATEVKLASVFPESARGLLGDPAEQNRTLGSKVAVVEKPMDVAELAKRKACLAESDAAALVHWVLGL